jgi:hypothetical protein
MHLAIGYLPNAIGTGKKARCFVKYGIARFLLVLLCIAAILSVTACIADEVTGPSPADPTSYPPGCKTVQPTPAILGDIAVMLVTGALLTLF